MTMPTPITYCYIIIKLYFSGGIGNKKSKNDNSLSLIVNIKSALAHSLLCEMRIRPARRHTNIGCALELNSSKQVPEIQAEKASLALQHKFVYYPIKELAKFRQSKVHYG
jgi:hypothetical protein